MFNNLDVLNEFSTYDIFSLQQDYWDVNHIKSQGIPVVKCAFYNMEIENYTNYLQFLTILGKPPSRSYGSEDTT